MRKEQQLIDGGLQNLLVVSDFDRTVTNMFFDNRRAMDCHDVLWSCPSISEASRNQADELFCKYYPIETSLHLSIAEKSTAMEEWYTACNRLLVCYPMPRPLQLAGVAAASAASAISAATITVAAVCCYN